MTKAQRVKMALDFVLERLRSEIEVGSPGVAYLDSPELIQEFIDDIEGILKGAKETR